MKTKTALLRSLGVLLALLVFTALPNSVLATCSPCHDPTFTVIPGSGNQLFVQIDCDCPPGATIFYRLNSGSNPTHTGATPTGGTFSGTSGMQVWIPYGYTVCIRALAWKEGSADSNVVVTCQHNPEN